MIEKSFQNYMLDEILDWVDFLTREISVDDLKFRKDNHQSIGWTVGQALETR